MSSNPMEMTQLAVALSAVTVVAACTNNGVDEAALVNTPAATQYSVGGTVSGLSGSGLVLQSNTGEKLNIAQSGTFQFTTKVTSGSPYYILASVQPQAPNQTCTITNATGTVSAANIGNVQVSCRNKTSQMNSIGGLVVGATGSGLVLQNNGGDNLPVSSNGPFAFATQLPGNAPYSVSVLSPPINPYQNCSVSNSPGMTGASDVSNIVVSCAVNFNATHTVGGTVTGLAQGTTLVLQDNGRDDLSRSSNGSFTFHMPIPSGSPYSVSVQTVSVPQGASSQSQTCLVQNASAIVESSDITGVAVQCTSNLALTVTVSGLAGSGLVLQNTTDGETVPVTSNGSAVFPTTLAPGAAYNITVLAQPANPTQICTVANGTSTGGAAPPTVTCLTSSYTVGGVVTGLPDPTPGANLNLVLALNGDTNPAHVISIPPNSASPYTFSFPTAVLSGSPYSVTVNSQPGANLNTSKTPGVVQTSTVCVVTGGSGTLTNANVNSVTVNCLQPTGFAYVTNGGDSSVSAYLVDNKGTVLPSSSQPVPTGKFPSGAAAYIGGLGGVPQNSYLYVTNSGSNDLSVYAIDPNTGALTATGTDTTTLGLTFPTNITIGLNTLYVSGSNAVPGQSLLWSVGIGSTGTSLTNLGKSPYATPGGPPAESGLAFTNIYGPNAAGACCYFSYYYLGVLASANTLDLYPFDQASGLLATPPQTFTVGTHPASVVGQSFTYPAGTHLAGQTYTVIYTVNSADGTIFRNILDPQGVLQTPTPQTVAKVGVTDLPQVTTAFADGAAFLLATDSESVWAFIANTDGSLTSVAGSPLVFPPVAGGGGPGPITGYNGNVVFVVDVAGATISVLSISANGLTPLGGGGALVAAASTGNSPSSILVKPRPSYLLPQ